MKEKLQKLLNNKDTPEWCGLLEEMIGQIDNYLSGIGECELAEEHHPDIFSYSMDEFMEESKVEEIPSDWKEYAYACIKKVGI